MSLFRRRVAAAALAAMAAGGVPLLAAAPAQAATGTLAVTPAHGTDQDTMTFDYPQACSGGTYVQVSLTGGNSGGTFGLVPNSLQSTYGTNSQGGVDAPAATTVAAIAAGNGFSDHNQTYTITGYCQNGTGSIKYDTFTTTITFGSTPNSDGTVPYTAGSSVGTTSVGVTPSTSSITTTQTASLTATVTPSDAVGTMEFDDEGGVLAQGLPVSGGTSSYSFGSVTPGTFHVTAKFHSTSGSFSDSPASSPVTVTVTQAATAPVVATPTAVTGSHVTGGVLTCTAATFSGTAPITSAISWLRAGAAIPGATGSSYTLTSDDYARAVACRTTGTSSVGSATSDSTAVTTGLGPAPSPLSGHAPAITGAKRNKARVGATLHLNLGRWNAPVKATKFQWLRNGKKIAHATKSSYKLVKADKGKKISCSITFTSVGRASRVFKTAAIAVA